MKNIALIILSLLFNCNSSPEFRNTVKNVEINKFMGKWYVIASRPTSFEEGAHNAIEIYTYDASKEEINIDFKYNKDSINGPQKSVPQKGYIIDKINNSYWKVSPLWPLKFDYLIISLEKDYNWTVIGVPDQKYIWIMARSPSIKEELYQQILTTINNLGYDTKNIKKITNIQ